MEAQIVSGLKRPASGKLTAGLGVGRKPRGTALRLAALCGEAVSAARRAGRGLGRWAVGRSISPNSLAGISLLLAICAAAWFSAGTGVGGARGLVALTGWLVALGAARSLAAFAGSQAATESPPGRRVAGARVGGARVGGARVAGARVARGRVARGQAGRVRAAGTLDDSTDWLILPGVTWDGGSAAGRGPVDSRSDTGGARGVIGSAAGGGPADGRSDTGTGAAGFGWMSAVCSTAAECAVYGGMAAGGGPGAPIGIWPLAVLTVASTALAELLAACRAAAVTSGRCQEIGGNPARRRWTGRLLRPPVGARALLAAAGFALAGPEAALLAVSAVEVISVAATIAMLGKIAPAAARAEASAGVLALRDDGAAARWAGRLVQGTLIPLPPAFAGLIATALLAALGLRDLPGFIALTPPVVMMLAAPGSSHPHDGRFDWLVPVLLAAAQYVYAGALGFALAVPGPVVFSACALTFLWYASLTAPGGAGPEGAGQAGAGPAAEAGSGIGWESRLFTIGLAATFGLPAFGYVGLATYLGALICREVRIGYLMPREDDRR